MLNEEFEKLARNMLLRAAERLQDLVPLEDDMNDALAMEIYNFLDRLHCGDFGEPSE